MNTSETLGRRCFGEHVPASEHKKGPQSPMAVFTRGLQLSGHRWTFRFANGYGASVIDDGYGGEAGLYELAVIGPDGGLCYDTPVTSDVLGFLSEDEVAEALDRVKALEVTA